MKKTSTFFLLLALLLTTIGSLRAQNEITYGFVQDPVDPLKMTAVAYPNFTSNNVTISTALFSFYLPAGTVTDPAVPVLPAFGSFTDINGVWRIEKITPALYASFGFNPNDLQGNDIYQCILQNSPSPNTTAGQPVSLFSFRLPADCIGGSVQVHINDNAIQMALLTNVGININNQMSVSVNDAPSVDLYEGNNPVTDNYDCPLDDVPVAVDDVATTNEDVAVTVDVTNNDSFGTDGPSVGTITIITAPTNGVAVVDNNGTPNDPSDDQILYTPNLNYNGPDVIVYQICDADNDCDQATVNITVTAVNDPPVTPNTTVTTPEETPVLICVPITDVDNATFNVTSLCLPDGGVVSGLTNPATTQYCLTYTPNLNYTGPDTLCIVVCDGAGACDTSYVYITVTPVNDPPVAPNTTVSTPEDTPILICVPITDVDNTTFAVSSLCQPDAGTISGLTNPATTQYCLTYTPNLNYNGPDTLCIVVCDGAGACDTSYVYITVTPVNDPPVVPNTTVSTPEDTPVLICVPITDVDNTTFNVTSLCLPDGGTISGLTNPATTQYCLTYTPNLNYSGPDTLCIVVCDGAGACDTSYVYITVTPVNDPPVVPNTTVTTPEDTPVLVCVPITDVDNASFNVTSLCLPDGGSISGLTNPATTEYCLTYTPNLNYNGPDTLCIVVCDGAGGCDTSYVYITVTPVNDPPVVPNTTVSTPEDTPVLICVPITDVDNTTFSVTSLCLPDGGTISGLTNPATTQYCLTYTPNLNYSGPDTLCIVVCDGAGACDTSYVYITVTPVNDPPVVPNTTVTTPEDTPVLICVPITDVDNASFNVTSLCLPDGGSISGLTNPATTEYCLTYTPNLNYNGPDTLCIVVCDGAGGCDTSYVYITVTPVNDPPIAMDDLANTGEDTPVTFSVTNNDTDVDGAIDLSSVDLDPNTGGIQTTLVVAGGTFMYDGAGNVTFTPNANFTGMATAQYQVCDTGTPLPAQCDLATITVTVSAQNDPPVALDDAATTPEDTPVTFNVTNNDTDTDGMIDLASLDFDPNTGGIQTTFVVAGGTFVYDGAGNVTFTPNLNFNGMATAQYQICDNGTPLPAQCDLATVTVTVTPVNDPPIALDDVATTPEDIPVTFSVTNNDTDVDGAIDLASLDLDPNTGGIQTTFVVAGGTFMYDGAGNVTFTPNANFTGMATAQYQVCDTGTPLPAQCDLATITVTVSAQNDPPIALDDAATTPEDTPVTFNVTNNDTDTDGMINLASLDLDPNTGGIQTTFVVAGGTFMYDGAGNVTFTPNLNFNGTASTQYQVCDNGTPLPAQCDLATITVTVTPVNDAPTALDDAATTPEDIPVTFSLTNNDTDVDGMIDLASLDLDLGTPGIQTSFTVAGGTFMYDGAGNVTFTPNANFNGTATAQYLVCDNGTPLPALCDAANISVTVTALNDPPVALDDNATTLEDTPITFSLTNNDSDVDGTLNLASLDLDPNTPGVQTTFTVAGQGTFVRDGSGNVTFTPVLNFTGTVVAQYQICDTGTPLPVQCDLATITVVVTPVNDPPLANNDSATTPEDTPVTVPVLNNDTDIDGTLNPASVVVIDNPNNGVATVNPFTGAITYTPNLDFVGNDTLVYTVCDSGTPILCDNATVVFTVTATSVRLLADMRLQGSVFNSPDTLMRDQLRSLGRIPLAEPYTALPAFVHVGGGGEMIADSATVLANYGSNSIVDWVFIELRNPNNPAQVLATRSALLQRDGDVVDVDGVSPLAFESTLPGFFYVAIRHRNHLGSMTANGIAMTNSGTTVDFTNVNTPLWDDNTNLNGFEQVTIGGKFALWAGNVNTNTSVVFAGQNNDKDPVFNQIDQAPGNIFHSQSYVYNGYHLGDVNMDGKAIFAGQTNDVDFIFNNVDGHPRNITHSQSYVIRQQLAE
jgi:hypothetical protein